MKSVGIDIHKRNSYLTVMDGDGSILKQAKITSDREALREFFDGLESPCRIAMESTYSWQWAYDFLEGFDQVVGISVAHPLKTKAIASARIKTDTCESQSKEKTPP
jgi:transposase